MIQRYAKPALILFLCSIFFSMAGSALAAPNISSVTPTTGVAGTQVTIAGTGFGASQGSGNVWLGNAYGVVVSWSDTQVVAAIASGAQSGTAKVLQGGVWSNAITFTVVTPNISSVTPTTGVAGTQVTIAGTGFGASQGSGKVWLGNTYGVVVSWSDTQVVATIASGAQTGTAKVLQGGVWSNAITFTVVTPNISSVTPTTGVAGTQVTIAGTGFGASQGSGNVWLGNTYGVVVSWSSTQVVAAIASGAQTGTAKVLQGGVWSNAITFTVVTPNISSVTPTTGVAGTQVTIAGTGFGASQGSGNVWLGNTYGVVVSWSDTQVVATIASGAQTGTAKVLQGGVWSNAITFTVVTPNISSVTPTTGVAGTQVTIAGTGFGASQGSGNVWLGNTYGVVVSWSDTQVVATIASGAQTGTAKVLQGGVWSNAITFTVVTPNISSVTPTTGVAGTQVTIAGTGFGASQGSGNVWLGNTYGVVASWSSTQVVATIASGAQTGTAKVLQGGVWSNAITFTVVTPNISSVTPTTGVAGTQVTIAGTGFGASQGSGNVWLGNTYGVVVSWSSTQVVATIASGAQTGTAKVLQGGVWSNAITFTVVTPNISSVTPTTGVAGTQVTIAGTGFGASQGSGNVWLGNTYGVVVSWSDTQVVATIASGAQTGTAKVLQGGVWSNAITFTVVTPNISSVTPTTGVAGTQVTIAGTGFGASQGSGNVWLGNTYGVVVSWSSTQVVATIASGAQTGTAKVLQGGVWSNAITFTVVLRPSITSLSVTSGAVGAAVTITGTGFGATQGSGTVSFNGTAATVTSWSATSLVTTVPTGATTGNVVVTVSGVSSNGMNFAVPTSWSNSYAYRRAITIDHTKVPNSDQVNFPFLLSGTYDYLAATSNGGGVSNTNGFDILFTSDAAGTTTLAFEQESYDASSGAVNYWINIPTLSHTIDTVIYLFYGNSSVTTDPSNKTAVWDGNYKGVWHLPNGTTLTANDSTANGNNLTISGVMPTSGQIEGGASFDGNSAVLSLSTAPVASTPLTLSAWVNATNSGAFLTTLCDSGCSIWNGYYLSAGAGAAEVSNNNFNGSSGPASANAWHYIVGVFASSTSRTIYIDGVASAANTTNSVPASPPNDLYIGAARHDNTTDNYFSGKVDEARISNNARSADWIATEYNNQSSPSTFYALGSGYAVGGMVIPTITGISPTSGAIGTSVTITGTDFGSTQGGSTVIFNGTTASPTSWNPTAIVTRVPSAATSGLVVVTSSGGSSNGLSFAVVPAITAFSATTGSVGAQISISGSGFGLSQGNSQVLLNGAPVTINSWTATSIQFTIPTGATSGPLLVSAGAGNNSNSIYFLVTAYPLPSTWLDQDVGSVGATGSATYSNGTFTVNGFGGGLGNTTDAFHFVYQPLSGDCTITARVVSTGGAAGVMIRETLAANSTYASVVSSYYFTGDVAIGLYDHATTGGGSPNQTQIIERALPYWVRLSRSGNTFTGYTSPDGVNWTQLGSSVTISMAQNVYIGMTVDGEYSGYPPSTFDNVSVNSAANPAPVITGLSATTGTIGSQVVVSGSNFGAIQRSSLVSLNGVPMTINSWSDTSITITIASGATSGQMLVTVGPSMNNSNFVYFAVTTQPLPTEWLDQDVGPVGATGNSTYASGTFTANGFVGGLGNTTDAFHFVYQPLSGDGTITARVVSIDGAAGVMIRETLAADSTYASVDSSYYFVGGVAIGLYDRATTGGGSANQTQIVVPALPYWVKLSRSGNNFTGYTSPDGVNWTQLGSSVTISMAQNVYIGMIVDGEYTSNPQPSTFDNVSINSTANPAPVITGLSATTGSIGSQVMVSGSNFGPSQGGNLITLNGVPMTVISWSDTSITITISSGAASGILAVTVGPSLNGSNVVYFTVTTQPLPTGWLDLDVGNSGTAGSAGYSGGTFTVNGFVGGLGNTADAFHFVYQPFSGDGTIVARVAGTGGSAGVMIRETLTTDSTYASLVSGYYYYGGIATTLYDRPTTGGGYSSQSSFQPALPYWVKLTRSGSTFNGYVSADGVYWSLVGSATVNMAQNVYIGMVAYGESTSNPQPSIFDNVSFATGMPLSTPNISGITPTNGGIGASVTVSGSGFGATQGSSSLYFNGASLTSITSWSDTQIVVTVPSTVTTGPVTVVVNGIGSNRNNIFTFYNPVISSLTPPAAPVGGTFTVSGSGFGVSQYSVNQSTSTVQINGVAAYIASWSDTSITGTVPPGDTSGPLTVTEGNATSNSVPFAVIEAATVTGVSPAAAPFGASVVITGTGFGPTQSNSMLFFYGGPAISITSWSDTSITAVVPTTAATGPLAVTVAGNTGTGPFFTVTASLNVTDSLGHASVYASESTAGQWLPTDSQGSGCSTCSVRGVIHNTFDSQGNVLTTTDPAGNITTNTYDSSNNLLSQSVQLNSTTAATTSYTYNSFGEVLTVTDPLGNVTTNVYDSHGNLTSVTSPAPNSGTAASVTTFAYNSLGELTSITDPLSHVTSMTYTTAGLIATITDAQNNVTTYAYDAKGNRTSVTDALSHQTTFAYDAMSRLTTITYPDSTTSTFAYDSRGRRTSVTDQNGKTTSYAYDDADRLTSVTDAASHVTYYAYDTEDNLTSITDANSNQTAFTYDAFGRVTQTNFPSSLSENYQYDANNNLTQKTDRKGQTITYLYDALNRLTSKTYPDTTAVDYVYDLVGKIQQVNDPTGTYAFAYDNMGRLIGTTTSYSFLTSRTFTNSYAYDAESNRTGFTDPESGSTAYSYDTLNRLNSLAPPSAFGSGSFGFSYDALSRRTQMTRPNSVTTNYTYDNLSRLTSVLHQLSGSTIDGASYTMDSAGNRTAKTDHLASGTSNYTYDAIYQLTQVTQANNTTESYSYDTVGNRTASLAVSSYTTNASNELTVTSNASYTYDSNGNTLTKTAGSNTTSYTWDFENRLTSVTLPGTSGAVTFRYDPLGRRIEKSSSATTSIYAYDGDNLIEEANSSGVVVARYTQTQAIDEPLAELRSSTTSYYEEDGLGSISSLTNAGGAVANTYVYDSFGKLTASTGSVVSPFQYTARESDPETGLYYYRARYYDSASGRFLGEDPIEFAGGIDFYNYVGNNPILWFDPFGLDKLSFDTVANLVAANNKSGQSNELIICVIYKESTFNPNGANPLSSAVGLMGVEAGAAKDLKVPPNKLTDPATNVATGTQYLHRRIDWSAPFGASGNVHQGLKKYGTNTDDYADSILKCEKCLKKDSNEAVNCKTKECLEPLHPRK